MTVESHSSSRDYTRRSFWESVTQTLNPGYIAAGLSTLVTTWLSIGNTFARNLYDMDIPGLRELQKTRKEAYEKAMEGNEGAGKSIKAIIDAERTFKKDYDAALEKAGITNIYHKWSALRTHQKVQSALTVFAISAVALGAVMMVGKNRRLDELERHRDRQQDREVQV